jgi:lipoate---protein ligase
VLFTGDFFIAPPRTLYDLESALRGTPVADAGAAVARFFAQAHVGLLSAAPADFARAVDAAVARTPEMAATDRAE